MFKDILLAVDLNDEGAWRKALPVALDFTRASGGTLHVLTVAPDFGMSIVGQFFPKGYEKEISEKVMTALVEFVDIICTEFDIDVVFIYDVILPAFGSHFVINDKNIFG